MNINLALKNLEKQWQELARAEADYHAYCDDTIHRLRPSADTICRFVANKRERHYV